MSSRGEKRGAGGMSAGRLAFLGLMLAFSLLLSYIESLIPYFFGVPGMKPGLPNLAAVIVIFLGDPLAAALVNALRIALSGFMFGSLFGIMFSLAGAAASFAAMLLFKRTGLFGAAGVSVAGGVAHNLGQLAAAVFIARLPGMFYYMPALILAGAVTGFINGAIAGAVLPRVRGFYQREIE